MKTRISPEPVMVYGNVAIAVVLATYFLLIPGIMVSRNLCDPAIRTGDIPREAWRLHGYLTPRYESWAEARVASGRAADVYFLDVPGTEWPLFGCVFYLWATEHLQEAWEKDPALAPRAPAEYARGTIEACKDLLLDPAHHSWVKTHWGDDYMHEENVFFRSLIIAGLTSYERLVGSGEYVPLLRDQVETLAAELDAAPYGVLHDYPGECYPIDVFAAVAWIRRADAVAGTDSSDFIERERRAFQGDRLDGNGLIPWVMDPQTGRQYGGSRGIVNSHVLVFAREIYPDMAEKWCERFDEHFWQEKWYGAGYREFYRDGPRSEWTFDVDSGPLIGGFSPSANAFGVAASRVNGRLDRAYTLTAQVLTVCWPLPDGRLLGPRLLSDFRHAPYLGEAGILWQLTETPAEGVEIVRGGHLAGPVYVGLAVFYGGGLLVFLFVYVGIRRRRRREDAPELRHLNVQFGMWAGMIVVAAVSFASGWIAPALIALLLAHTLPRVSPRKQKARV